jgi:hypothetical protein
MAINSKEKLSFIIEGPKSVWKLLGIHPRFGPAWAQVTEDDEDGTHEITGSLGDIFKIYSSDSDYTFVTISEGPNLKEINHIVFEDFTYSISRRWYNILQNTGTFKGNLDEFE